LRRSGDRGDRKPHDPKQMIDALLLEAPRDQGCAIDVAHGLPLVILLIFGGEFMHNGAVTKVL
jgi:hypothetical protein